MVPKHALIPIRDIHPRVRVPLVNYTLLALTGLVFVWELSLGEGGVAEAVQTFGFLPGELRRSLAAGRPEDVVRAASTVFTSLFLHQGWLHGLGNAVYLHVFGDIVEERFGHAAYLLVFLLSAVAGASAQLAYGGADAVPMIGASGAIAGLLGAYLVLYPRGRVVTLLPVFIFLTFVEVPALLFPWLWAAQQLLYGYMQLSGAEEAAGVAWCAHLGGFAFGLGAGLVHRLRRGLAARRGG